MNLFGIYILMTGIIGCSEKEKQSTPTPIDSGIVVGPPPEPASTDTAEVDTGIEEEETEDTAIADSGFEDTADTEEDTAIADSGIEDTGIESQLMPDFSLPDVNPYSSSVGTTISVRDQLQKISGWYFIKATWSYCRGQFALLTNLQNDLKQEHPELEINILSINQIGAENGTTSFTEAHALPMVNDSETDNIWVAWESQWRDFYILNRNNELIEVYNLTQHNLNDENNYNELKQKLIDAAQEE